MTVVESANNSPYWPPSMHDPSFLPWFSRLCLLARNSQAAPAEAARCLEGAPPEWVDTARFLLTGGARPCP